MVLTLRQDIVKLIPEMALVQFRVQTLVCAFDCQRNRSLKAELLTACLKCISTLETMNASESHRDADFVCGGDRFVVLNRFAEIGDWCQACDLRFSVARLLYF